MKRKPLPPRPDGKPRRKFASKKQSARKIADAMLKRGALRLSPYAPILAQLGAMFRP
jgi:hypothetical protein